MIRYGKGAKKDMNMSYETITTSLPECYMDVFLIFAQECNWSKSEAARVILCSYLSQFIKELPLCKKDKEIMQFPTYSPK